MEIPYTLELKILLQMIFFHRKNIMIISKKNYTNVFSNIVCNTTSLQNLNMYNK